MDQCAAEPQDPLNFNNTKVDFFFPCKMHEQDLILRFERYLLSESALQENFNPSNNQ